MENELRSLKKRVEILENFGAELSSIEKEINNTEEYGELELEQKHELVGFQTLQIINGICQKELENFEQNRDGFIFCLV